MRKQLLYIALFLAPMLWLSCEEGDFSAVETTEEGQYMQLSMLRSGSDDEMDEPCFIFWKQSDYIDFEPSSIPTEPYVYCYPEGVIDDYNVPIKYNTKHVYPPLSEWVCAVGVSPSSLVPAGNLDWKEFDISRDNSGLVDIRCASVVMGSQQSQFSDPLIFAHQLTKLEILGYCGSNMKDGGRYINVKDIRISISSDTDDQWNWFPQKLMWEHGTMDNGQYKVVPYTTQPSEITATISTTDILHGASDISKDDAKVIGSFYLVPGFSVIKISVEAIYVDSTNDGTYPSGNGQEIARMWNLITIDNLYPDSGESLVTRAGEGYPIKLSFDRSKIELGLKLEDWSPDIDN